MSTREMVGGEAAGARRRLRAPARAWWLRLGSVLVVLIVWQLTAPLVNPLFLRPPSAVVSAFVELSRDGTLPRAILESLRNFLLGFGIALAAGLLLGIAAARWRSFQHLTDPWVAALYSLPSVALVPFLSLWLGVGNAPKVAAIALFAVFPILINTQQGVRLVDPELLEVARSFCSSERRLWLHVLIPGALPMIFAGVRLAIPRALVGMIVAEFLISFGNGLGSLIIVYQNVFRVDRMFVPVIVVAVMGVIFIGVVQWLERRVAPWAHREQ
ncbi:MAG TPA: ABC transporter permease [Candidatus Dormibacteraeota bacterium]|jgi:ABC-type nitrate/sulfonate/bicarbonate transport system permease component|nr:ABC transporter permease [Candidatus Dormibacteraeota bacterium]